jgi:DNA topoisomerase-1
MIARAEPPKDSTDPVSSARSAGLRYVTDSLPGIVREKSGGGFRYRYPTGQLATEEEVLRRIKSLAIPPAWTDVWICPDPCGHLQATGRDDRGRKQFRYHPRWREVRDETKYGRMLAFAKALPRIRKGVLRDLRLAALPRNKVLATVVRLLEVSLIRVGNEEYARENASFGLTTMRTRHVDIHGSTLRFHFRGKSGKWHEVDVRDPRLAKIVRACHDLPGQELFQYVDEEGERRSVDSNDVNDYLREITGADFTAKDFRTWAGTVLAAMALCQFECGCPARQAKRNVASAIQSIAQRLGNTPAVCRKCYVHPEVIDAYMEGALADFPRIRTEPLNHSRATLGPEESAVLHLLQRRLAARARREQPLPVLLRRSLDRTRNGRGGGGKGREN